jgi:hypothetical protein
VPPDSSDDKIVSTGTRREKWPVVMGMSASSTLPPNARGPRQANAATAPEVVLGAFPRPRPGGPLHIRAARRAWFPSEMSGRYPGHGAEQSEVSGLELQRRRS